MRPRISSAVLTLVEERTNARGALPHSRRPGHEQRFRHDTARWPDDAVPNEPCKPAVVAGPDAGHRFEAGNRSPAVDNEHGRPALYGVNQCTEIVLRFGNTGLLHNSYTSHM